MDAAPLRYSVELKIAASLRKAKSKTHDICCAWGYRRDDSEDTLFNIVGWASDNIVPQQTIAWTEEFHVSASQKGWHPASMVSGAMSPVEIARAQRFVVKDFDDTHVESATGSDAEKHSHAFLFEAEISCSIVLYQGLDLDRPDDNYTSVFIASDGDRPFISPPAVGSIKPARSLLIFFAKKKMKPKVIRGQAFDTKSIEHNILIYDYGSQSSQFTSIELTYGEDGIQITSPVETFDNESRFMMV